MTKISMLTAMLGLVFLALLFTPTTSLATKEIAQSENLECTSCHHKPGSVLLTDRGKFFETMGTLEGYDEVVEAFQRCTYCHVAKPGAERLTENGKKFADFFDDMEGLRAWVIGSHPSPSREVIENGEAQGEGEGEGEEGN